MIRSARASHREGGARGTSLDARRAEDLVRRFVDQPVLVVGDVMLDRFIVGRVTRISPEAPVPVVQFQSEHSRLGGAANVAHNIAVLGGRPSLVGLVGADAAGGRLSEQLGAAGVGIAGLVTDPDRPTTEKVRVVTERNQQVARIDYERDADVSGDVERQLVNRIVREAVGAKAFLVSDYLKGVVTRRVVEALVAARASAAPGSAGLIVDPKIPHLACYAGATLVTPNHLEAEAATHCRIRTDEDASAAAREFRARVRCDAVLITRGEHGMWLSTGDAETAIPSIAREVSDVTGAGDTVVATLALALAAGATMVEAAILANHAAGVAVGKFGPATVTPQELIVDCGLRIED
ncbi:MAG TPA: D-glycero-beta-D-manno-heptose-7-phosphate kinase [Vicinamibacterales bacterium]|jgi:D-beta-D-heptose 7-phosphate kinase/D-beta-D-heptose 1-phosphate adenosyltransferase|nr:D-glycero-beta-D-manno-heptose-7-phosphate kinase [Vicinamibacterales bacterium]